MTALTFRAIGDVVFVSNGNGPGASVTQDEADAYCALFLEHGLKPQLNDLWEAMQRAAYVPWCARPYGPTSLTFAARKLSELEAAS